MKTHSSTGFLKLSSSQIALFWRPRIQPKGHMLGAAYWRVGRFWKKEGDGEWVMARTSAFGVMLGCPLFLHQGWVIQWGLTFQKWGLIPWSMLKRETGMWTCCKLCSSPKRFSWFEAFHLVMFQLEIEWYGLIHNLEPTRLNQDIIYFQRRRKIWTLSILILPHHRNFGRQFGVSQYHQKSETFCGGLQKMPSLLNPTYSNGRCFRKKFVITVRHIQRTWFMPCGCAPVWTKFGKLIRVGTSGTQAVGMTSKNSYYMLMRSSWTWIC